jgi:hypothetical protein
MWKRLGELHEAYANEMLMDQFFSLVEVEKTNDKHITPSLFTQEQSKHSTLEHTLHIFFHSIHLIFIIYIIFIVI